MFKKFEQREDVFSTWSDHPVEDDWLILSEFGDSNPRSAGGSVIKAFQRMSSWWNTVAFYNSVLTFTERNANSEKPFHRTRRILLVEAACSKHTLMGRIQFRDPFHGSVYVRNFPFECMAVGDGTRALSIVFGIDRCGTQHIKMEDGQSRYEAIVYVQFANNTQRGSDESIRLSCVPRDVVLVSQLGSNSKNAPKAFEGRLDLLSGGTLTRQVREGVELKVEVTAKHPAGFDVRVVNCVASDGSEHNQKLLIDSDGCSVDSNIMENFRENQKSKTTSKTLHSMLRAFRFPRRSVLHIRCSVILCNATCIREDCEVLEDRKVPDNLTDGVDTVHVSCWVKVLQGKPNSNASPFAAGGNKEEQLCLNSTRVLVLISVLLSVLLVSLVVTICTCVRAKELRRRLMERS
ncbi:ZP domain-containing protein [Nephila pilipes]|uniref:ZP domain-containing protein n=1 Tax=Nephila pilipes TaxID=299642 RepID=A0A8X6T3Y4_NEPPI|nr:ZP domain-containing protein [Nephila pilipes]